MNFIKKYNLKFHENIKNKISFKYLFKNIIQIFQN